MQAIKWMASYVASVCGLMLAVGLLGFTFGACFGAAHYAFRLAFNTLSGS